MVTEAYSLLNFIGRLNILHACYSGGDVELFFFVFFDAVDKGSGDISQ